MVADWVVVELEPAGAARSGLPARLAVPREVAERGDPIERVRVAEWSRAFVAGHADHELAPVLLALVTAEPYRRLGERLLREERFEEAVPALARAIELTSFDAASRFNLGVALRRADEPELALSALDEAEWAYSSESAYHVLRGRIWEALNEEMRAVLAYERALELAPGDGFVLERLEALGALMKIEGPDGEIFWLTPGDFERVMRHELASASNDPDQLVALGDRLLGGGHVALAASAAELALAAGEGSPGAWALAGLTRQALGRDLQARDALVRAAALDPSNIAVARALVQREDDPDGGLPRAHAEVQRRPASAAAWIVLGDQLAAAAQPREALGAYAHALDLDPALHGADHAREALRVLG
jgi:tetratricopeptide (TPR) repeat protein